MSNSCQLCGKLEATRRPPADVDGDTRIDICGACWHRLKGGDCWFRNCASEIIAVTDHPTRGSLGVCRVHKRRIESLLGPNGGRAPHAR